MEIKFKQISSFTVVGLPYQGKNENNEISALWPVFNCRAREIRHVTGDGAYGICSIPAGLPEGVFEYVCALPVVEAEVVPAGMVSRTIPDMKVAVFEHHGSVEKLGETYTNIYQKWLPAAGLQPLENGFDMELYKEDFTFFAPDSVMYIYVPVKE